MMRFSYSQLYLIEQCPEKYRRRYVNNERTPGSLAMIRGRAQTEAQQLDLETKMLDGELAPEDVVTDAARDLAVEEIAKGEHALTEDEELLGKKKAEGQTIDHAVRLEKLHHNEVAPELDPLYVEPKLVFTVPGIEREVVSYPDVIQKPDPAGFHDLHDSKTKVKKPNPDEAASSAQLVLYSLGMRAAGLAPGALSLDFLVAYKRKPDTHFRQSTTTSPDDEARVALRLKSAIALIEAGHFPPAPEGVWWCSAKWCEYHSTCPYVRGGKVVTVPGVND